MRVMLATLCLNELQWLPYLYEQHKEWPDLVNWTFVESADVSYAKVNPSRVSKDGLSVDGTSEYLHSLAKLDKRVTYIPHGFCSSPDKAQAKCQARNRYLRISDEVKPDVIIVVDADEFYNYHHQDEINKLYKSLERTQFLSFLLPQRHIWHPPSQQHLPLTVDHEVVGGYWNVPHCRVWRWSRGLIYLNNHNWPQTTRGHSLTRFMFRGDLHKRWEIPYCVHMGFASLRGDREAKHRYYEYRGEDKSRKMYVECRTAYENWQEGQSLPHGAKVVPYKGQVPEVFSEYLSRLNKLQPTTSDAEGYSSLERAIRQADSSGG